MGAPACSFGQIYHFLARVSGSLHSFQNLFFLLGTFVRADLIFQTLSYFTHHRFQNPPWTQKNAFHPNLLPPFSPPPRLHRRLRSHLPVANLCPPNPPDVLSSSRTPLRPRHNRIPILPRLRRHSACLISLLPDPQYGKLQHRLSRIERFHE